MAFGDSSALIDNFNRSNEGPPPSSSYATPAGWGGLQVTSNECIASGSGGCGAYWTTLDSANCEAYFTISGYVNGAIAGFYLRCVNPGTDATRDGYRAYLTLRTAPTWDEGCYHRIDNGVGTQLGGTIYVNLTESGLKFGMSVSSSTIGAYYDGGGGWTLLDGGRTDATYTDAGYVMLYTNNATPAVDNLYGTAGSAAVTITLTTTIASTAAVSTPAASPVFAPSVIASTATVLSPGGQPVAAPTLIASTAAVSSPAAVPVLAPTAIPSTATVPNAILTTHWAWPTTIASTAVVYNPTVSVPGTGGGWWRQGRRRRWDEDDEEWLLLQ